MDWRSDLDFAVEGLCRTDYARAWSMLDTVISLPVDLVCIERASPFLKNEILTRGRKIYEA